MNMAKKIQKFVCALLACVLVAVPFCTLTVGAETDGAKAPTASPYLAEKLAFLENLYGDAEGTGIRVIARWAKANEDNFFDGDPNELGTPEEMLNFAETLSYTFPIVFEYALSPEFGNAAAGIYRSMAVFDDFSKIIETAEEKDDEKLTMVMLEVYPDFVNAVKNSFDAVEETSPENAHFFYTAVREKLAAEIAFDGEEKTFPTDKERENAALDAFYANFPEAEKTGLALFPQAFLSATFEEAIGSSERDTNEILKALSRSQIVFDDLASFTEVLLAETTDGVMMKLSETIPDLVSTVDKIFPEAEGSDDPANDVFIETLFRISTVCADLHGHVFGTPVYLYNAALTECTAIAFCECGASVTETVKMTLENGNMTAVFTDPHFEKQGVVIIIDDPEEKPDPDPLDPKTDPDGKENPENGLAVTMTVLAVVFFLAAVAFAVLFFLGKKKNA